MQLCQNEYINGRSSRRTGLSSSKDVATRSVGPINQITLDPTHVINDSNARCLKVYGCTLVALEAGDVVAVPT